MKHERKLGQLILAAAIPLAVGALAAFLTRGDMRLYALVQKPPLSPPAWLFPVAWTILYILMGLASGFVYSSDASQPRKERALTVYAMQLTVNFFWPIIFFSMGFYLLALLWLILLWVLVLICTVLFYYIHKSAGLMLVPYMIWLSFAAYLNLGVYLLN